MRRSPSSPAGAVAAAALALVAALAAPAPAARQDPLRDAIDEDRVQNDCFLPNAELPTLAEGDAHWAATPPRRVDAFEAWRRALVDAEPGAVVEPLASGPGAAPGEPALARRRVGVAYAVLQRLVALEPADRAAWTARFGPIAAEELARAASSSASLADVERRNPATAAAARACLRLADLELERGALLSAATWCERGTRHAALAAAAADAQVAAAPVAAALARRADALDVLRAAAAGAPDAGAAWRAATAIDAATEIELPDPASGSGNAAPTLGAGLQPGAAWLADGRVVVQTASRLHVLEPGAQRVAHTLDPARLLPARHRVSTASGAWRVAPGWPCLPATDGRDVAAVLGRWFEDRGGNAIVCLRPPAPRVVSAVLEPDEAHAQLRWACRGSQWFDADGAAVAHPLLEGLDDAEYQAAPLATDGRLLALARVYLKGDVSCWLVAFDFATGEPLWRRFLAKGTDLAPGAGRFQTSARPAAASQPLLAVGTRVFVPTGLGAGWLVDVADGRPCWALKNRRRDAAADGWAGVRNVWVPPSAGEPGLVWWAPSDGDHLYALRDDADLDARRDSDLDADRDAELGAERPGLFRATPRPIGEARALVGGDRAVAIALSFAGPDRTVSALDVRTGGRTDAIYLARGERFTGPALASTRRVLFASDAGLYLLDRERDLYLLDHRPPPPGAAAYGGAVFARGDRVLVVGPDRIWSYSLR